MKRWSMKRLGALAFERERLARSWNETNKQAGSLGGRLAFLYSVTPASKVPQLVQDQAARMLNYCRKELGLGPVTISWIEWELKRRTSRQVLFVRTRAICGIAATKGDGRSWSWPGDGALTDRLLMRKLLAGAQGDVVFIRWDLPLREMLLTIAHEARHLWHAAQGSTLDVGAEDAECEAFAVRALNQITGGKSCSY